MLAGTSTRYEALELVEAEADAILAALGVERPDRLTRLDPGRGRRDADDATSRRTASGSAFLRADAVGPGVRALAWGDRTLFGVDRVTDRRRRGG